MTSSCLIKSAGIGALAVVLACGMAACSNKEKKAGQTVARVNGEEITIHQLNDEVARAGLKADADTKPLLDSLINRELLHAEAIKNKVDRDPAVLSAIENAKTQIVVQAYLQSKMTNLAKPGKAEIDDYFAKNPQFFSQRKVFDMRQLVLAAKDSTPEVKARLDSAKSLDEIAAWLDEHKIQYMQSPLSRTTAELPPELSSRLQSLPRGSLFIFNEGARIAILVVNDIKDSTVNADVAAKQIEQFLTSRKSQEVINTEIARLKTSAKIEYVSPTASASASAAASVPAASVPAEIKLK